MSNNNCIESVKNITISQKEIVHTRLCSAGNKGNDRDGKEIKIP